MRPVRISLQGFSAYREAVEVDFSGVDFFSLTGHTGSGKSSLVDAMIFALFGRVPRLGGNAVAPAITAGADRARVRFDFEVGGTAYTVARMAQRTPTGGASVREARLQQADTVLASGADEVTSAVEVLLRLRFDDFTRTVVLPQGDFARFLAATKSERQGLLRTLLGLDVYTLVRDLARTRAAVSDERAEGARRALDTLDLPDAEAIAEVTGRRDALAELSRSIVDSEKELAGMEAAVGEARAVEQRLADAVQRLDAIEVPERLDELDALIVEARSRVVDAGEAHQAAVEGLAGAESVIGRMPSADRVDAWRRSRERLGDLDMRLASVDIETARETSSESDAELAAAVAALQETSGRLAGARTEHAAHSLAMMLEVGGPCPVCDREVTELPPTEAVPGLAALEAEEGQGRSRVDGLSKAAQGARTALTALEASRTELTDQRAVLATELDDAPSDEELTAMGAEITRLRTEVGDLRELAERRRVEAEEARFDLERLADMSRQVAKKLTTAQLRVADLDPPVPESDDVIVQWKELIAWAGQTRERLGVEQTEAGSAVAAAAESAVNGRVELEAAMQSHDLEPRQPFSVQVATALEASRARAESYEKAARDADALTAQIVGATETAAVASALAGHLKANGFEQWLMAGAITDLVGGANDLLSQLSDGGYSLHSDDSGSFSIVDHRNADEMRSVSTLSGGETFLVSLALALSLAETLAAKGGAGLDAIILDEGFGTLDDESLDTVASVLEELAGRGLMVGVITHVKELASRAPDRYEVVRGPAGADVRRVS